MCEPLEALLRLIRINDGINDKARLARLVSDTFGLTQDRSVYYCAGYAIRFSSSGTRNFGKTVLSLSNLRKIADDAFVNILEAPSRAIRFVASQDASTLKAELDTKVATYKNEILLAALIENVNVRGRVIEYLIAGDDEGLRQRLIAALRSGANRLPPFKTDNALGDYQRLFDTFDTETDVKTKLMILNSNPKAYNLDKMLQFLEDFLKRVIAL